MKCPNCGYENPAEGTKDNRCDQCGALLAQNKSAPHSTQIVPKQFINCGQRLTLLSTLGLDLAVLIVIWSFISIR